MKKFKISHDRPECTECGACVLVTDNWYMAEDGKADPRKTEIEESEFEENMEAAEVCPVNIIHIHDEDDKKLI